MWKNDKDGVCGGQILILNYISIEEDKCKKLLNELMKNGMSDFA
ncbi:hypothetical protein [Variimorphobacter saccharofermentans]|nr:hypothetical protein [Variimorphobacter saccharofermentans]